MKTYKEFHIRTAPFLPDLLSGLLWELNISGLTEEQQSIIIFSEGNNLSKETVENFLRKMKAENLFSEFSVDEYELENKNWNEEWEKNLNIIKVNDKLVIKPSTKEYNPKENEIVLTIDPKMSFGTGEHQTTKLMLKMIERYVKPGMKVLDVGSGTAILAIASVKLGAVSAVAVDNDELCFANGIENIGLNEVSEEVEVRIGELKDINESNFDMILANIQKNVILGIADDIRKRLINEGIIILSGLLNKDEEDVVEHYKKICFNLVDKERMDEWTVLVLQLKV
ncbi:MAG TPA: 50S ribosomal protein L11 methyltransferase [Ignavibacteriaceae bacterium]|jgi:ribosomal protein L11 methyltransferase